MTERLRRSDISDLMVCAAYDRGDELGVLFADEKLAIMTGAPQKVVEAAIVRAVDRGLVEYGVTMRSGWLTAEGARLLREWRKGDAS